jgi:hypothetical protein
MTTTSTTIKFPDLKGKPDEIRWYASALPAIGDVVNVRRDVDSFWHVLKVVGREFNVTAETNTVSVVLFAERVAR